LLHWSVPATPEAMPRLGSAIPITGLQWLKIACRAGDSSFVQVAFAGF
jgi:hypothetical protein